MTDAGGSLKVHTQADSSPYRRRFAQSNVKLDARPGQRCTAWPGTRRSGPRRHIIQTMCLSGVPAMRSAEPGAVPAPAARHAASHTGPCAQPARPARSLHGPHRRASGHGCRRSVRCRRTRPHSRLPAILATPDSRPALTRPSDRGRYARQTFAGTVTVARPIYNGKTSSCSRVHGYVIYLPWTSAVLIRLSANRGWHGSNFFRNSI